MSGITVERAKEYLEIWLDAEKAVATGQSYKIGSRSLTRANLSDIRDSIRYWRNELEKLESGRGSGARVLRVVPRDL